MHPEQLSARLVLRLARFARLLILDGLSYSERNPSKETTATDPKSKDTTRAHEARTKHKILADRLFDSLPLLSVSAQLRERTIEQSKRFDFRPRRNSSHVPRAVGPERQCKDSAKPIGSCGTLEPSSGIAEHKWSSNYVEIPDGDSSRKSSLEALLAMDHRDGSFANALNRYVI
ncbi:unnamed protein product [Echinostoma caproni]|uniref:Uncharacterized protein n=1 Tax=Echinostoma caproni TaxID=27848 RepID=A0A3P8IK13_9TREM|nr:unnamed protein product [Echinostoma caproni]